MKVRSKETKGLDITGSTGANSDGVRLRSIWKQWLDKVRVYSLFAALPGIATANTDNARAKNINRAEAASAEKTIQALRALRKFHTPKLVTTRRPLPGQRGSFDLLGIMAGKDDCPGEPVPPGTYTTVEPYVDPGDTTQANNTVNRLGFTSYYYYGNYYLNAYGPDHVYRFEMTARGPNPEIKVTSTSSLYIPLIYVLDGANHPWYGACPNEEKSVVFNPYIHSYFDWVDRSTRIKSSQMNSLPLNRPLFLFVDSDLPAAPYGAGPYTVRFQDVTLSNARVQASVSGRVTTPGGLGLRNASVYLIGPQGARSVVMTGSLGYFTIAGVEAGKTYQIGVSSKRYRFETRDLEVNGNLTEVNFTGLE